MRPFQTVTAHMFSCVLNVGMDVNQYIHQGAAQSQKFMTTNMATTEEILIMYIIKEENGLVM